jgi:hypothetical protein
LFTANVTPWIRAVFINLSSDTENKVWILSKDQPHNVVNEKVAVLSHMYQNNQNISWGENRVFISEPVH